MEIKKKAIAVKLSKKKSKNGYFLVRWANGRFGWQSEKESPPKEKLKPHWMQDCIV